MPKFSIIVPAYNVGDYIQECLESICAQTLRDIEAVIVDDASRDKTAEIAQQFTESDTRITLITHPSNRGQHLARMSGVLRATGEYILFLDGDDALAPNMCEQLASCLDQSRVDILHYGVTVVGSNGILPNEVEAFSEYNNRPIPALSGEEIVRSSFDPGRGFIADWRFTQRVYRAPLIKRAFSLMTDNRLERSEDGYEYFVAASLANSYRSCKEINGYIYYYGRGITGTSRLSADEFGKHCRQFKENFDAAYDYARTSGSQVLMDCALGFERKATELLANDWAVRVDEGDKRRAAVLMSAVFGPEKTNREVYRLLRDNSYEIWASGESDSESCSELAEWRTTAALITHAKGVDASSDQYPRMKEMQEEALLHLREITDRNETHELEKLMDERLSSDIKIFVTAHKPVSLFRSNIFQPVQVGSKINRLPGFFQDDDGDNIARLNPMYCELTTQYWAWKNVDAQYYGFCHYRRYFDFSSIRHEENDWGEIIDGYVNEAAQKKYGLDDETMRSVIEGYDVITTEFKDIREFPSGNETIRAHYEAAPLLHVDDLDRVIEILKLRHPDYSEDADAFLSGYMSCFCNMFIMRREIFQAYCEWLFPILEEYVQETDMSRYSREALRTPGHLSERLFNIYYLHQMRVDGSWKTRQLQCVHFEHPEPISELHPISEVDYEGPIIPVVFASDDNYVPMLTTTMFSMLENASPDRLYDIVVLNKNITWENQETMWRFLSRFSNLRLSFYDVSNLIERYPLTTSNPHISIETYYRFLIQEVLPYYDKVLYLDSDLIVEGDVAELFDVELGDNLLAAAHDIDYLGNLNMNDGNRMLYSQKMLGMQNPYDYFQAGVLVLNTAEMRRLHDIDTWLTLASNPDYIYNDQDVLNAECEGRVVFLEYYWNVMINCDYRIERVFSFAPADALAAFMDSRLHEKIVHYAGYEKPWLMARCDRSELYWSYARQTPFYEKLLSKLAEFASSRAADEAKERAKAEMRAEIQAEVAARMPSRAMGESNPIRKIIDPIMPVGSNRREIAKALGRTLRGRK